MNKNVQKKTIKTPDKVLEVKNLSISFKTPNGFVKAVRDVSFDLYNGETLAIVGESGSGKSVTNRAIMGILSGNGIIDEGEILYRNQDLTKLSEANFHLIRGSKIGMIFQDPLSSLNPIMRVGKQITEAMLVNGNRLKNRFHDLYHNEYHDYLNVVKRIKLIKNEQNSRILEVNLNEELSKDAKKAKIAEIKQEAKRRIAIEEVKLPELKATYKASKKDAKAQINEEKKVLQEEARLKINKAKEAIKGAKDALKLVNKESLEYKNAKEKLKTLDKGSKDYQELKDKLKTIPKQSKEYLLALEKVEEAKKQKADVVEQSKRLFIVTKKEAYEKAIEIMREVNIPEPEKRFYQYPFQFSGGMRQRVVIAIALTANPEILICDEPTTALDVTIQGQILDLIKQIKKERNLSVIFITHDLGVVANMADRVAVMYAGKIVEYGTASEIFYNPKHPYTWALLSSVPDLETKDKLSSIPGTPPDMLYPPRGDAFAERNEFALKIDFEEHPPFFKVSDTHYAATWLLHEDAPKIEMPSIITERIERYQCDHGNNKDKKVGVSND